MRTSQTVVEFRKTDRHDLYVSKSGPDRQAPSYCLWCGAPFVFEVEPTGSYDEYTGEREIETWVVCPNRTKYFRWSYHTRYKLTRLTTEVQQRLLGDALVERAASG